MREKKTVFVYTDGSCSGNPGPGGWCAMLKYKGNEKIISGGEDYTTNNRMELAGVVNALRALKEPCEVIVTCDSRYVVDAIIKGWLVDWKNLCGRANYGTVHISAKPLVLLPKRTSLDT